MNTIFFNYFRYSSNSFDETTDENINIKNDNINVTFQEQVGGLEKSKSDSKINQVSFLFTINYNL